MFFLAHKPGASNSGDGMTVERHPVSILNEYGQKKGVKVIKLPLAKNVNINLVN